MSAVLEKCKTLIVEDDPGTRIALSRILQQRGHVVQSAATVAEALKLLAWEPDCVLLDLMLPDGLGLRVLRHIRENDLPIRVAVISAAHDRLIAEAQDADIVMRKPINFPRLEGWLDAGASDSF